MNRLLVEIALLKQLVAEYSELCPDHNGGIITDLKTKVIEKQKEYDILDK